MVIKVSLIINVFRFVFKNLCTLIAAYLVNGKKTTNINYIMQFIYFMSLLGSVEHIVEIIKTITMVVL